MPLIEKIPQIVSAVEFLPDVDENINKPPKLPLEDWLPSFIFHPRELTINGLNSIWYPFNDIGAYNEIYNSETDEDEPPAIGSFIEFFENKLKQRFCNLLQQDNNKPKLLGNPLRLYFNGHDTMFECGNYYRPFNYLVSFIVCLKINSVKPTTLFSNKILSRSFTWDINDNKLALTEFGKNAYILINGVEVPKGNKATRKEVAERLGTDWTIIELRNIDMSSNSPFILSGEVSKLFHGSISQIYISLNLEDDDNEKLRQYMMKQVQ